MTRGLPPQLNIRCKERFAPVCQAIDDVLHSSIVNVPILIAIDGRCASGKSTLGFYLQEKYGANLFHMDDFFLTPSLRTDERLAEVGGNVDYERFKTEVLDPVSRREDVSYRIYDCQTKCIQEPVVKPYNPINIIEGSYALHPSFGDIYKLKIFTDIPYELQLENIRKRNGEMMLDRFINEWIPKEEAYFDTFKIRDGCIMVPWVPPSRV